MFLEYLQYCTEQLFQSEKEEGFLFSKTFLKPSNVSQILNNWKTTNFVNKKFNSGNFPVSISKKTFSSKFDASSEGFNTNNP